MAGLTAETMERLGKRGSVMADESHDHSSINFNSAELALVLKEIFQNDQIV